MKRQLYVAFPDLDIKVTATMQDEMEPELCELLWNKLPLTSCPVHTLSTGDFFISRCRPPREAQSLGTQDNPLGRHSTYLCNREAGDIGFTGLDFWVNYGPNVTEPMPGSGAIVAKVDPECMDDFFKAGKLVWNNQKSVHKALRMVVERKEN